MHHRLHKRIAHSRKHDTSSHRAPLPRLRGRSTRTACRKQSRQRLPAARAVEYTAARWRKLLAVHPSGATVARHEGRNLRNLNLRCRLTTRFRVHRRHTHHHRARHSLLHMPPPTEVVLAGGGDGTRTPPHRKYCRERPGPCLPHSLTHHRILSRWNHRGGRGKPSPLTIVEVAPTETGDAVRIRRGAGPKAAGEA